MREGDRTSEKSEVGVIALTLYWKGFRTVGSHCFRIADILSASGRSPLILPTECFGMVCARRAGGQDVRDPIEERVATTDREESDREGMSRVHAASPQGFLGQPFLGLVGREQAIRRAL